MSPFLIYTERNSNFFLFLEFVHFECIHAYSRNMYNNDVLLKETPLLRETKWNSGCIMTPLAYHY